MKKVSSSVHINRPIREVFEYTASPFNGPAFIPGLNENRDIRPNQVGVGQTFNWRYNLGGVDLIGEAKITEYEYLKKVRIESTGDATTAWIYTFNEENGGTRANLEVEYEFPENILKRLTQQTIIDKLNQRVIEEMGQNLKIILEE